MLINSGVYNVAVGKTDNGKFLGYTRQVIRVHSGVLKRVPDKGENCEIIYLNIYYCRKIFKINKDRYIYNFIYLNRSTCVLVSVEFCVTLLLYHLAL